MGLFCMAPGCSNEGYKKKIISYHALPLRNKERLGQWLSAMKLKDPPVTRFSKVCSDHFERDCYERDFRAELMGTKQKKFLKDTAVPTIFDFSKCVSSGRATVNARPGNRITVEQTKANCRSERRDNRRRRKTLQEIHMPLDLELQNSSLELGRSNIPVPGKARKTIGKEDKPNEMEAIQNHVTRFHMSQQLVIKEEMLPEQQELNLSVDQKDIKQEQEEVWTSNEGQQLHRLETEKTKLHFVPVKTENDDEIPQSSQVLQNSDMLQQLVIKEEMLPEQQELNLSVDQKDIKQEQEEVWTSNEEQQLHRLETEKTKLHFVPVKTENDDEIPQSSQVLQNSDTPTLLLIKQEILSEQHERNLSVDQEDIKEEQEKLWIGPQVQQLHQLEEADITKYTLSALPVPVEKVGAEASVNSFQFFQDMLKFKKTDPDIAQALLDKLENHRWYLTHEVVPFALFSTRLSNEEKQDIAAQLYATDKPHSMRRVKPVYQKITAKTTLSELIDLESQLAETLSRI
ncbi:THAP domain-containing protein 5-like [Thalassophryne amazonica]|uniref:THAP domain-containing protein 5-like n=1 Tax=Thalassophryne amazonica TaxID=390379 RepID=UPI001470D33F|nr:THAP domain-containing protein 5-like [Thalassophryne amazonica]